MWPSVLECGEKLGGWGEVQRSVLGCKDVHFKIFSYFRIISNFFFEFQNLSRISNPIAK